MAAQQYIQDILAANGGALPTTTGQSKVGIAGDYATATAATATVTYASAGASGYNVLGGVYWSYSGSLVTTPGVLTILDGATVILSIDITSSGPGFFPFSRTIRGTVNTAMSITLSTGGTGIVGKVTGRHWTE